MRHLITLLIAFLPLFTTTETPVSDPGLVGAVPRLTTDAHGNAMLSWVEKTSDKDASFYFAVATDGKSFGPKIRVKTPSNIATHPEGMPKLEARADGTLLAIFEVPTPTPESRFAGDLLYTLSADNGQSWTDPVPVYQNMKPGTSHSYGDLARLPNGEIGIVWLDEKRNGQEGRPVLFAQTTKGKGVGPAVLVDDNACQCCRTNLFVDSGKAIRLTYRDLLPSGKAGEPAARDISTAVSTDGGKTFSPPKRVFADNWQVNACPHAGPAVAQVGKDVLVTWFSGKEASVGLRLARPGSDKLVGSVLSNRARHPQVAANGNQLIWVWDESVSKDGSQEMGSFVQRIGMRTMTAGVSTPTTYITPESTNAAYPVVLATKNGILVAYEKKVNDGNTSIVIQYL